MSRSAFAQLCGVSAAAVTKACASALQPACEGKRLNAAHPAAVAYREKQTESQRVGPATGIDPRYDEAVAYCQSSGQWSMRSLQAGLGLSFKRAQAIIQVMQVAGLIGTAEPAAKPSPAPHVRGHSAARETRKAATPADDNFLIEIPPNIEAFADMTLREVIERFGTDVRFVDWLKATKEIEMINEKRIKNAQASGRLISRDLVERGVIDPFNGAHLRLMTDGAKTIAAAAVAKHASGSELIEIERYVSDVIGSFLRPVKSKITRALKAGVQDE